MGFVLNHRSRALNFSVKWAFKTIQGSYQFRLLLRMSEYFRGGLADLSAHTYVEDEGPGVFT
jgi:hypothetical protein